MTFPTMLLLAMQFAPVPPAPPAVPTPLPPADDAFFALQRLPDPRPSPTRAGDPGRLYDRGQRALDERRWEEAASLFSRLAQLRGPRADAATYWIAYAQNRLGQRADALQTIATLVKSYPSSLYVNQARALEVEVRRDVGQPVRPESQNDEELKLFALQALQRSDPDRAIPMLEALLRGTSAPRLKTRALFVLAQGATPRARQVVADVARGTVSPELQEAAIEYLGRQRDPENRALLSDIYSSTNDIEVKRRLIRAFAVNGERDRILAAATGEPPPELRAEAVRQLGALRAFAELLQLYRKEADPGVKRQMLQSMLAGGDLARLVELARTEPNSDLRRLAVRNLGVLGRDRSGPVLLEIYGAEKDPQVRRAAIDALFIQRNSESLVALARKEPDPGLKRDLVERLSQIPGDKVALDYLVELLK